MIRALQLLCAAATCCSIAYYILCWWSASRFRHDRQLLGGSASSGVAAKFPVSILKPLKGVDPEMVASFRSHCVQEYGEYEILFGVSDPEDPAIEAVEQLKKEFPQRQIRLIFCSQDLGANTKVSNLAQMVRQARHEHLVVSDSDIRVESDYLRRVVAPLSRPEVGLVTCLYRGMANSTLGSKLESLGISTDFCAGVLVARMLEGIKFGLGSTLAFRRRDLESIGGFEALADYLADDYQLGHRLAAKGLEVELSDVVVETFLPRYSAAEFLRHQLRWARTIRDSRFWGYVGLGFTFGLPWAVLGLLISRGAPWAWGLLAITMAFRAAMSLEVGAAVLQDRQLVPFLYLVPLRDLVAFFMWIASFAGHTILWRGESFRLQRGKLTRIGRDGVGADRPKP
jgi:ceramide glucosyltransferase